jgi:hypothetical protein
MDEERRLYAEGDEGWTEPADHGAALARQMVEMRAFTLAGLQAKAIAMPARGRREPDHPRRPADDRPAAGAIHSGRPARVMPHEEAPAWLWTKQGLKSGLIMNDPYNADQNHGFQLERPQNPNGPGALIALSGRP